MLSNPCKNFLPFPSLRFLLCTVEKFQTCQKLNLLGFFQVQFKYVVSSISHNLTSRATNIKSTDTCGGNFSDILVIESKLLFSSAIHASFVSISEKLTLRTTNIKSTEFFARNRQESCGRKF